MSRATAQRAYDIHGTRLLVDAQEPDVGRAVDLRLRSFATDGRGRVDGHFHASVTDAGAPPGVVPPAGIGRPIYDAPDGSVMYYPAADVLYADMAGVRFSCAPADQTAYVESRSYDGRSLYIASHPLTTIALVELLKRRGHFSLHAACLARNGRGIVLAGPSGAGKSTLAMAAVRNGLSILADDMIFLDPAPTAVRALAFPDAVGVTEPTIALLGELGIALDAPLNAGFPKRLVRLEEVFDEQVVASCVPEVLIFPELSRARESRLTEDDPERAWLRLVPDVLMTEPVATQAHLGALARLLEQVRCYRLQAGTQLERSVELIAGVL